MISNIFSNNADLKSLVDTNITPEQQPLELNLSNFLYEAIDASKFIHVKGWSPFFDAIPADPYIKEGYRYKSIAWFRIKHVKATAIKAIDEHITAVNKLSGMSDEESVRYLSTAEPDWQSAETGYCRWHLPQYAMQQSIKYNPVHGDMRREYSPISRSITDSDDFHW